MYDIGVKQSHEIAPWAYDQPNDTYKQSIVRRESVLIQTHNAVSVAFGGTSASTIISCSGYDSVALGIKTDAVHLRSAIIDWFADSGGTNWIGQEPLVAQASSIVGVGRVTVKAPYCKVWISNNEASGVNHAMSSWTTLIP